MAPAHTAAMRPGGPILLSSLGAKPAFLSLAQVWFLQLKYKSQTVAHQIPRTDTD